MSLALHQLRHEFRRSRVFLAVYFVILLGNYAVAAGWIGQPEYNPDYQGWGNQSILSGLIALAFWISVALLIMGTITADSPANRGRFLASRPFPVRSMIIAKTLFVTLALLLPATVVELLSLLAIDAPDKFITLGTIEHFLLLGIFASFIALFAAHWKSAFTAKLGLAATIGIASAVIGGLGALLDALTRHSPNGRIRIPEPTMLTAALSTVVICLGLAVTLRLHTRRQWTVRHLILPFAGLSLLWFALAVWIPVREFSLGASEQDLVHQTLDARPEAIRFTPTPVTYSLYNNRPAANYTLIPVTSVPSNDWEIRWSSASTEWSEDGRIIHRDRARHRPAEESVISPEASLASPALLAALQVHAPGVRLLVSPSMGRENAPRPSLRLGMLSFPKKDLPRGPISVGSQVTASAYRWKLAADLPFDAFEPVHADNWTLAGVQQHEYEIEAYVILHTYHLHTISNSSPLAERNTWTGNVLFALHIPERKMVWIADTTFNNKVATLSSAQHTYGEIRFQNHGYNTTYLTNAERKSARFLIFQAQHLGEVTKTFRSPEFALNPRSGSKGTVLAAVQRPHKPKTTPGAFALWLAQHKNLPTDLPADQFRNHLDELFGLERRSSAYLNYPHSPGINHLARFVPRHRDIFIESIHGMTSRTSAAQIVLRTLSQGATEDDKSSIIAALADTPILIDTITDRGWTADAHDAIIQVLKTTPYDLHCISALVSLDDPDLDGLLLASYEASPTVPFYEVLLTVPRLREKLNEITTGCWSPGLFIMGDNLVDQPLELALTQGRADALAHLYQILPHLDRHGTPTWKTANLAEKIIALPNDIRQHRHDSDKMLEWLRQHKAADFRFDPVLRRFVLTDPNTI